MTNENSRSIVIIGSGPAGLTAALYAARANLAPLVIEGFEAGGQLMLTTEVENFPGFVDGIMGPELMDVIRKQSARFGTEYLTDDVSDVDLTKSPFEISVGKDLYLAQSVIVSTGASARWIGLQNETRLRGRGVSTCATCDGAFFRDRELAVVGGGDSAMEEAIFLTRFATKVTVIHRRDELRASKIMQDRAQANPKIEFIWNTQVEDVIGSDKVEALKLRDVITDQVSDFPTGGLFVAIGHTPNTSLFKGKLELDPAGYIVTGNELSGDGNPSSSFATRTSVDGVFAAGDVVDHVYRQAITAAGMGCMAAMDAERWLESRGH
ncbi:MAG TPA: thioredoxin-disulfide reductase [Actinomycetota bacterium]|nr:thioredoxin-disulfide reductase [Actinomycetota bacterium]